MQTLIRPVTRRAASAFGLLEKRQRVPTPDVQIDCVEDGHEEASKKNDAEGQVAFQSDEVESGTQMR